MAEIDPKTVALIRDSIVKSIDGNVHYEWFMARDHFLRVIDNLQSDIDREPKWTAIVDGRGRHIDYVECRCNG